MFDFLTLKNTVQSVTQKRDELLTQIREGEASLTQIRNAPTNKSDLTDIVSRWVDASAANLQNIVTPNITKKFRIGTSLQLQGIPPKRGVFELLDDVNSQLSPDTLGALMCAAFGPQIKEAIGTAIKGMDWTGEGFPRLRETKRSKSAKPPCSNFAAS